MGYMKASEWSEYSNNGDTQHHKPYAQSIDSKAQVINAQCKNWELSMMNDYV
jgi:hypothetical protein